MTKRIFLADDHRMFRDALRLLLERVPRLLVVGEAGNGSDVLRLVQQTGADIVCMDIGMPGMNGIKATRQLLAAMPATKVIALSTYAERRYVLDMFDAGVSAYVTKAEASEELLRAIEAVRSGRHYLCPDAATLLTGNAALPGLLGNPPQAQLSPRERAVLVQVAKGRTSAQIAEQMSIAPSTVEVHRRNIMRKLDLHSIAELTRYVISCGFDQE